MFGKLKALINAAKETVKAQHEHAMALGKAWAMNRYGEATTGKVIGMFVGAFLFAILMPIAFNQIFNTNFSAWDNNTQTVFKLVPIIVVVAFLVGIIYSLTRE